MKESAHRHVDSPPPAPTSVSLFAEALARLIQPEEERRWTWEHGHAMHSQGAPYYRALEKAQQIEQGLRELVRDEMSRNRRLFDGNR